MEIQTGLSLTVQKLEEESGIISFNIKRKSGKIGRKRIKKLNFLR